MEAAAGGGEVDLGQICSQLLGILKKELGGLLSPNLESRSLTGSTQGFNFLENSYWPEVVEQWLATLTQISSASLPSSFHQNYTTSLAFLASVEEHCRTEESLEKLRSHLCLPYCMESASLLPDPVPGGGKTSRRG